jgi:hypothetical protein
MPDPVLFAEAFGAAVAVSLALTLTIGASSSNTIAAAGSALGVVTAVCVGLWVLGLLPHFPPREDLDRIMLIVLPGAAIAEVIATALSRAGWATRGAVSALCTPVLLSGSVYVTDLSGPGSRVWTSGQARLIFAALAALLMTAWTLQSRLAIRFGGSTALVCLAGTALGTGLVVMLSGYATGGQLGLPLSAGLCSIAIGSLVRRGKPSSEAALAVGIVGLFSLLIVGRLFADLTTLNAALLFAAPLAGWLPELLPAPRPVRVLLRLALTAATVVLALVLVQQNFAADSGTPESGTAASVDDNNGR